MSEPCDGCAADATHFLCDLCASEDIEKVTKERDEARAEVERLSTWGPLKRLHTEMTAELQRVLGLMADAQSKYADAESRAERAEANAARLRVLVERCAEALNESGWYRLADEARAALAGEEEK